MINDVVRLQQERVMIMTQVQWKFNLIKQWLTAPNDVMGFEARGSSVYGTNNLHNWGPKFATDGKVSNNDCFYFHSDLEMQQQQQQQQQQFIKVFPYLYMALPI